jgi:hypothetical protein
MRVSDDGRTRARTPTTCRSRVSEGLRTEIPANELGRCEVTVEMVMRRAGEDESRASCEAPRSPRAGAASITARARRRHPRLVLFARVNLARCAHNRDATPRFATTEPALSQRGNVDPIAFHRCSIAAITSPRRSSSSGCVGSRASGFVGRHSFAETKTSRLNRLVSNVHASCVVITC